MIDKNRDGKISFEEFVLFISAIREPSPEDRLTCKCVEVNLFSLPFKVAFCLYDEDCDGKLSFE